MTAPTTTTYDQLKNKQSELIRKALEGSVFLASYTTALPTRLTAGDASQLVPLPDGFTDLGWVDKGDGATWSRSVDTSDVESWGAVEPTRSDGECRARVPVRTRPGTHSKSFRRVKSGTARKHGWTGI